MIIISMKCFNRGEINSVIPPCHARERKIPVNGPFSSAISSTCYSKDEVNLTQHTNVLSEFGDFNGATGDSPQFPDCLEMKHE